jgi:hypothetical protein
MLSLSEISLFNRFLNTMSAYYLKQLFFCVGWAITLISFSEWLLLVGFQTFQLAKANGEKTK